MYSSSPETKHLSLAIAVSRRYNRMSYGIGSITCVLFCVMFFFYPLVLSQLAPKQRATMISLYRVAQSSSWNITKEPDPCSWKGVSCTPNSSSIVNISLPGFSLSSPEALSLICQIESLQSLDLSNNHFSSIPGEFISGCGSIDSLKLLNFSANSLVGSLPAFTGFLGLESLDFSRNSLSGEIGMQLHELVSLKYLSLGYNQFRGSLPSNLGKSMALERLELSMNSFNGSIPESLLAYQNLTHLGLSNNFLSGALPDQIGGLSKLQVLILSSNKLTGSIPATLSSITFLSRFAANQNKFTGSIPSGITRFLTSLDVSYNMLSGSIPLSLLSSPNLEVVDLSYNLLEGSVPGDISRSLLRLRLGSNKLSGVIPSESLGTLDKLTYLELENNSLVGTIPAELGSCKSLALLNLGQNELNGSLPAELGNLTALQVMKLELNKLVGVIPNQITRLHGLLTLNMSWNSLSGPMPSSISELRNLTLLNLQGNNLNGSIPDGIGSLTSLLELQLGQNQLSGEVPRMPSGLQIALNLSTNQFQVAIPATISLLSQLEVLDLSNNNFFGEIPTSLAQMGTLTHLILFNNNLSGDVPTFSKWVHFNASGNPGLIYPAPPPQSHKRKKSVSVAVILTVGFSVLAVGLIIAIALFASRRFDRVTDVQLQPLEEVSSTQVIQGNLLSSNGIHRSNIDFAKAMEAVSDPLNITLKTRFSTYYKATMPSGMRYFIKKLNWSDKIFQLGSHDKFGQELEALGKLSNSNVMIPLAYVLTADSAYVFYEYAPKGTLFDALHGSMGNGLDWGSRYSIAVGVAQGLAFLHGCSSGPVMLLDLSTRSILLKSSKEPQVGDIELCKVIDPSKSTGSLSTVAGSVGYVPPEYAYTMRVTMAGNVYSFGVILLELLTGKPAVSEGTELAKWVLSNNTQRDHILDSSMARTSVAVKKQMLAVFKVALSCVSVSADARPKMKNVLRMLLNAR